MVSQVSLCGWSMEYGVLELPENSSNQTDAIQGKSVRISGPYTER